MANINDYLKLITSEHNQKPNFMALVSLLAQAGVDQQNLLASFSDLFDVDEAVGDQLDKIGQWVGVSRNLKQAIDIPLAEDNFQRANATSLGSAWTSANGQMGIAGDQAVSQSANGTWAASFWTQNPSDNFTRANENPLNPAEWAEIDLGPVFGSTDPLQIISDKCCASDSASICGEAYVGALFGDNQLSEITIGQCDGAIFPLVRFTQSTLQFYVADLTGPLGPGFNIAITDGNENQIGPTWTGTVNLGDTIGLRAVGSTISVELNGTTIISGTDTTVLGGIPAVAMSCNATVLDTYITNWTSGPAEFTNDQFAECYITNGGTIGPAVRMTLGGNFYALAPVNGNTLNLYVVAGGVGTIIQSVPYTPLFGDLLCLEIQGTSLVGRVNGVVFLTDVDTTYSAGSPGIAANNGAPGINSSFGWFGGDLPGVTSLDDEDYRTLLFLFIAQNAWDGTVPGIYNIWNQVFGTGFGILVQDNQDMSMLIAFLNPPTDVVTITLFTQGFFLMRPAGVRITGFYAPSVPGTPIFGADVENSTISGPDVGALAVPINI